MTANPFFLPSLNCLQISGEKAGQLLHGQFTNNIRDLTPGTGNYNLFLTVKGKVLADLHILRRENDFLLLIPQNFYALIAEHLQKLAPLSRVLLQDVSSQWQVLHVLGTLDQAEHPNTLVFRTDRLGDEGYDVISPIDANLADTLIKAGVKKLTPEDVEILRIKNGVPKVGVDVTEANLPQEAGLAHALNFTKGCYLGQEIVARLEYRGRPTKKLRALLIDGAHKPGAEILENGELTGHITSISYQANQNQSFALGFVKNTDADISREFTVDGAKAILHVRA